MAKKPAVEPVDAIDRPAMLNLLRDLAESEHHLRHRAAFPALCAALGFDLAWDGVRWSVADPSAPDPASAPAAE